VIENCWFLEIMPMLGGLLIITVLPELNSSTAASTPIAQHIVVVIVFDSGETGSGSEEREDAADPDAKCSGGVGAVDGMRIGDDGVMLVVVVVVVMVERRSGGDDEEVAQAYHAHIGGGSEAVVDRPGGRGGPHSGGGSGAGSGGGWSGIEAEGELIRRGSARAG
jgi:hypothetical protein